jgi:hypothetical protein
MMASRRSRHLTIPAFVSRKVFCMGSSSTSAGLGLLVFATLASAEIMSQITGSHWHWLFVIPGILVGLWAARSIR